MSYSVIYQDIGLKDYKEVWDYQESVFNSLVEDKLSRKNRDPGTAASQPGTLIFVEHKHVFTLGKSGSENNLLADRIQLQARNAGFFRTDRGGDITYHGPGQLVGYPIFDLEQMRISLREYIYLLEESIIRTISGLGLSGSRLAGATGVWLDPENQARARKICAIGVKASRYITMHGFAFNVNTDLTYFNYINPCGLTGKGVTSLEKELGHRQDLDRIKQLVRENLQIVFDLAWTN